MKSSTRQSRLSPHRPAIVDFVMVSMVQPMVSTDLQCSIGLKNRRIRSECNLSFIHNVDECGSFGEPQRTFSVISRTKKFLVRSVWLLAEYCEHPSRCIYGHSRSIVALVRLRQKKFAYCSDFFNLVLGF